MLCFRRVALLVRLIFEAALEASRVALASEHLDQSLELVFSVNLVVTRTHVYRP